MIVCLKKMTSIHQLGQFWKHHMYPVIRITLQTSNKAVHCAQHYGLVFTQKTCSFSNHNGLVPRNISTLLSVQMHRKFNIGRGCHLSCLSLTNESEITKDKLSNIYGKAMASFFMDSSSSNTDLTAAYFEELERKVLEENKPRARLFSNIVMIKLYDNCNLDGGTCFMNYLSQKGKNISLITRIHYLALLGRSNTDHKYDNMIYSEYEKCLKITDVSEYQYGMYLMLINAFATTGQWKKCLDFQEFVQVHGVISYPCYHPVLMASLENGDFEIFSLLLHSVCKKAVHLMENINWQEKNIQIVFKKYIEVCDKNVDGGTIVNLFEYFKKYHVYPDRHVAEIIKRYLVSKYTWKVQWSFVDNRGYCNRCQKRLDHADLTKKEFKDLRDVFLDSTLHEGDSLFWSKPEEVERFKKFLQEHRKFDVVIDSLNVVYSDRNISGLPKYKVLQAVVDKFVFMGKNVLVIGRQHANRKIYNAETFLVHNRSKDDFFILFAALHSGPSCLFVSRDYLRDSKFKLGKEMGAVFQKWQRSRQMRVKHVFSPKNVALKWPANYDARAQETDKGWHIPVLPHRELATYESPNELLCVHY